MTPINDERLLPDTGPNKPVENIVIQRLNNAGSPSGTMIIKIPPTTLEHNMVFELLKRLRHDFPGAWAQALHWERQQYVERQNVPPVKERYAGQLADVSFAGIKEVTREHLGLPHEDMIGDVPA